MINFNADIANTNGFKSFAYKAKLLGNTEADKENGILRNVAIAMSLKYLSDFSSSLEMSMINCKVELKLKWTKYCVLVIRLIILIILFLLPKTQSDMFLL